MFLLSQDASLLIQIRMTLHHLVSSNGDIADRLASWDDSNATGHMSTTSFSGCNPKQELYFEAVMIPRDLDAGQKSCWAR